MQKCVNKIYLHDAMITRFILRSCVCPHVRLKPVLAIETATRTELGFSTWVFNTCPTLCCKKILVFMSVLPSGTLSYSWNLTLLLPCRHSTSTVASVVNLVRPMTVSSLASHGKMFASSYHWRQLLHCCYACTVAHVTE